MLIFFIILMVSIAALNFLVTKSFRYPPSYFAVIWAIFLFALLISDNFFYPVSLKTLTIFTLANVMFSLGGLLVISMYQNNRKATALIRNPRDTLFVKRFLDISLLLLLLSLPIYWQHLQQLSTNLAIEDFWISLRTQTASGDSSEQGFGIFAYLTAFSTFIAIAACYENNGSPFMRLRAYALITISLIYNVLTVSRLGAVVTIFGVIGVILIRDGRIKIRTLLIGFIVFSLVFSVPAMILKKGGSLENDISENTATIFESFQLYSLGGLVAFDSAVDSRENIETNWLSLRFFSTLANSFGADFDPPSLILDYAFTPQPTNLYTMFFAYYFDFGFAGLAVLMFIFGALTTWIYLRAINGDAQAAILYGLIFASLLLSSANEPFLTTISYWMQAILFTFVFYKLPLYWNNGDSSPDHSRSETLLLS
ncbi:MAG: O-antigen polymerase [Thermoleophilia bacterium]